MADDRSAVESPKPDEASLTQPLVVRTAVRFIAAGLLVGWLQVFASIPKTIALIRETYSSVEVLASITDGQWTLGILGSAALGFFINLLILYGVHVGKNWVRKVYLATVIFGVLGLLMSAFIGADIGVLSIALRSVRTALDCGAALLLIKPTALAWFTQATVKPGVSAGKGD